MAFTITPYSGISGNMRTYHGTFTSAATDNEMTLNHGFNYVAECRVTLETGAVGVQNPKVTHSGGNATVIWDDTLGYSGTFYVVGR